MRGTFANIRLRNALAGGPRRAVHRPSAERRTRASSTTSRCATPPRRAAGVIAGREYGSGSSRDWAAKGPALLGVKVVLAESFERIHRSNLVGMGVLPLQFKPAESAASLGLTGRETYAMTGLAGGPSPRQTVAVTAFRDPALTVTGASAGSMPSPAWTARSTSSTTAPAGSLPAVLRRLATENVRLPPATKKPPGEEPGASARRSVLRCLWDASSPRM